MIFQIKCEDSSRAGVGEYFSLSDKCLIQNFYFLIIEISILNDERILCVMFYFQLKNLYIIYTRRGHIGEDDM